MQLVDMEHSFGHVSYPARPGRLITDFVVHHSQGRTPTSRQDAKAVLAEIDRYHRESNGWPGFAYHRAVWEDTYFLVRPRATYGWHSAGADRNANGIGDGNDYGLACVILGTHTSQAPSARTLATLAEGWLYEEAALGRSLKLSGHQDWWATACPGAWWPVGRLSITHLHDQHQPAGAQEDDVPVPDDYRRKFGVNDWPGVAANLEGIIRMLIDQNEQLRRGDLGDEEAERKLNEIRLIVNR